MPDQWDAVAAAMRAAVLDTVAALGVVTPPAPTGPTSVDLSRWKLTIPEVRDGKVVEIKPPALATYTDRYFARVDGALRFRCWHGGATTSGSSNPRSELRELNADGTLAKWSTRKGRHELTVRGQVNRLTKVRPHVVLAQLHGGDDDVTTFRLEGQKLWITRGDDTHAHLVTDDFRLGQPYELRILAVDGEISYAYQGREVAYRLDADDDSVYAKAGAYLQSNPKTAPGESTDEYAEVLIYGAQVTHS